MASDIAHKRGAGNLYRPFEKLTLPQMVITTGAASRQAARLITALEFGE